MVPSIVTAILILFGAGVMLLSIWGTRQVLALVRNNQYAPRWRVLLFLMAFFLLGYLAAAGLSLAQMRDLVLILTGVVFFFGALFVLLVVRLGYLTISDVTGKANTIQEMLTALQNSQQQLKQSEERAVTILNSVQAGIVIIDSATTRILDANPAALELIGAPKDKIIGSVCQKFICPSECGRCPILNLGQQFDRSERELLRLNGQRLPILKTVVPATLGGRPCLIESFLDISERKQIEQALHESKEQLEIRVVERTRELQLANEQLAVELSERKRIEAALRESQDRYALAVSGANDGLWDWNLKTNEIYYSPRWKEMLGYAHDGLRPDPEEWFGRVHPDDLPRLRAELSFHLEGPHAHFESEYRIRHADGEYRWMLSRGLAVRDDQGRPCRMAGSQTDVTRRKLAEEKLMHDALHDSLTGLPNRSLFLDRLDHAIKRQRRPHNAHSAVLFLDLDRFKLINDSLGHMLGDELLVALSRRLEACLRPGDTVARFGGDEFAILLEGLVSPTDATQIAERIQNALQIPFNLKGHQISVSASIGIAGTHRAPEALQAQQPDEILRDADTAMYRAKALGKAQHQVFNTDMHAHAISRLELESDLRQAIERGELDLHYQPVVDARTRRTIGVEALLRWKHPQRGLLAPGEFISIAEETGLIVPLGRWVLRAACDQAARWRADGLSTFQVAINFSAQQIQDPGLIYMIDDTLSKTGLPGSALQIEITESTMLKHVDLTLKTLVALRARGIQIALDDFGSHYSALGMLKQFPFDILKIDQSFVRDVDKNAESAAITQAIVTMGRGLKLEVVAEGVETGPERDFLSAHGCDALQGYLFCRPQPGKELGVWLQREGLSDAVEIA